MPTENTVVEVEELVCDGCREVFDEENLTEYEDELLCDDCLHDREYSECQGCGDNYHNGDLDSEGYCVNCSEESDEENYTILEKEGELPDIPESMVAKLTSDRTFGIEFEMFNGNEGKIEKVVNDLGFSYSGDGSIEGNHAIEVQTSVLKRGDEDSVRTLLKKAKSFDFQVNTTCGTHIHLGGEGFVNRNMFELTPLDKLTGDVVVVETVLYKNMISSLGETHTYTKLFSEIPHVNSRNNTVYSSIYRMANNKLSKYSVIPLYESGEYSVYNFVVRDSTLVKLGIDMQNVFGGNERVSYNWKTNKERGQFFIEPNKLLFFCRKKENTDNNLIRLFKTYHYYNDLFMGMLLPERATNTYCKGLGETYSLQDINNVYSQSDVEKLWYKSGNFDNIAQCKQNHYDRSRYHAVNLHSLFTKFGTVEIRSHHATLNAESILMWVKLHQTVLDTLSSGNHRERNRETKNKREWAKYIVSLFNDFVKEFAIKENSDLYDFIVYRLNKYSNVDLSSKNVVAEKISNNTL